MRRVFVEKKEGYDLEARDIHSEINGFLKISSVESVRILTIYDTEGLDGEAFDIAVKDIFSQPITETVYGGDFSAENCRALAVEFLPGQYDQRSDFATQCTRLIANADVTVKCGKLFLFYGDISDDEFAVIKSYLINPVECRGGLWPSARTESPCRGGNLPPDLDLSARASADIPPDPETVETLFDFRTLNADEMKDFCERYSINMDMDDALFCQQYFKKENRDPTITEMRVFDTYWSDHCRHSTFMTILDSVEIDESIYSAAIKDAVARYYAAKEQIGSSAPHCLMDVAIMGMKKMRHIGLLDDMEDTDEVNACSIEVDVTVDGKPEKWLFMFKNETHNHPTEIEPFGGASTCLGGGIRDPLSGRAFVHGAIRLTGSGDPREPYAETLRGKLPQRKITKTAAEGYSSYSNQIGLASGHLSEIYDPGFRAKRMECGALVAGVKKEDVTRLQPVKGDVIVLIGGNTGRDGIGGATGSSKEHDESSLEKGGAEVQKGNPAIERNIVRLFRDPKASKLIKKCNDFGAGGVSVAVCELADSLVINLDTVPLKYGGLDGTEIAIS
ncbi:MAG: AIR synthase-related protein, partial [Oscillospiraceae bacterium]|nr:AIR synthase-related protein [Oscillospiraceae bacterium]